MAYAWRWLRSLVFIGQMYVMMLLIGLFYLPFALWDRKWAFTAIHVYCNWVRWTADLLVGLKSEVRGEIPDDEVIIAAKHQSFFDVIMLVSQTPRPKFIMKKQLKWAPVLGFYGMRIGCIPVDRGKRGQAIRKMVADVKAGTLNPGQLIIYPQGTRVAPGVTKPFKVGPAILYEQTGQDVVPVATNVGVFWPKHGIYRKPGVAVVEFLPRINAGMSQKPFMVELEQVIEAASDKLLDEAGFHRKE